MQFLASNLAQGALQGHFLEYPADQISKDMHSQIPLKYKPGCFISKICRHKQKEAI
jgi:hypothetical protein